MAVTLKLMLQFDAHYDVEYSLFQKLFKFYDWKNLWLCWHNFFLQGIVANLDSESLITSFNIKTQILKVSIPVSI